MATKKPPVAPPPASAFKASNSHYPGAFALFKPSKDAIIRSWKSLALTFVLSIGISIVIGIIIGLLFGNNTPAMTTPTDFTTLQELSLAKNVNSLLSNLASIFLIAMSSLIVLSSVRGKVVEFSDALSYATKHYVRFLLANILAGLAIIGGLLLFIIPGIIIAVRLSLLNYVLLDNEKLGAVDAFKKSWELTKGHSGKIWGIIGVNFLMILPIFTIIGIPVSIVLIVLYAAASAILYTYLIGKPHAKTSHHSGRK